MSWSMHGRPVSCHSENGSDSRFHGGWSIEESNEFVWVISYDRSEGFAAADAAYYASEERRRLSPDPAEHIVSSDQAPAQRVL